MKTANTAPTAIRIIRATIIPAMSGPWSPFFSTILSVEPPSCAGVRLGRRVLIGWAGVTWCRVGCEGCPGLLVCVGRVIGGHLGLVLEVTLGLVCRAGVVENWTDEKKARQPINIYDLHSSIIQNRIPLASVQRMLPWRMDGWTNQNCHILKTKLQLNTPTPIFSNFMKDKSDHKQAKTLYSPSPDSGNNWWQYLNIPGSGLGYFTDM